MNFNNSTIIETLCNYINSLLISFRLWIFENLSSDENEQKIKRDAIIYVLISNFMTLASPIVCSGKVAKQLADEAQEILGVLNNKKTNKEVDSFVEYFDMIYTYAIANMIRGGSVYQCEDDYSWLIRTNYENWNIGTRIPTSIENEEDFRDLIHDQAIHEFVGNDSHKLMESPQRNFQKIKQFGRSKWIQRCSQK